jgi:cytochrome b6-f complex iron-sulfur subunit
MKMAQNDHDEAPANDTVEVPKRRRFLNWLWALLALGSIAEAGWLAGSIVSSKKEREKAISQSRIVSAGEVKEYLPGTVTAISPGQFYLARLDNGSFLALSPACTHLGCSLNWDPGSRRFICPCHGSTFDIAGEVLTPPAIRGLASFPLQIENGIIKVDISVPLKHQQNGQSRSIQV